MGLPRFFPSLKHRVFDYKPIYYNEQKEELENRIRQAEQGKNTVGEKTHFHTSITRGSMRGYIKEAKKRTSQKSNLRLVIILILLVAFAIYLFLL
ncbi:MAG: hypothetical protein JXJ22_10735 [Bacteroidales bacterium]|nr:hypothetical protein [Bacteroidales bacterium]